MNSRIPDTNDFQYTGGRVENDESIVRFDDSGEI
jgi:hypothetical protein